MQSFSFFGHRVLTNLSYAFLWQNQPLKLLEFKQMKLVKLLAFSSIMIYTLVGVSLGSCYLCGVHPLTKMLEEVFFQSCMLLVIPFSDAWAQMYPPKSKWTLWQMGALLIFLGCAIRILSLLQKLLKCLNFILFSQRQQNIPAHAAFFFF